MRWIYFQKGPKDLNTKKIMYIVLLLIIINPSMDSFNGWHKDRDDEYHMPQSHIKGLI